jgi:2-polyprenyl-3-methyl-5-hydroxy-6-metoxy-1,4-benzoquinol methylase
MDNAYAQTYRNLYESHWWWRARERFILDTLQHQLGTSRTGSILDVGCGDGLFFNELSKWGSVEGVEIDDSVVSRDGRWRENIYIRPFDSSFQPNTRYKLILMLDVLEHLPDPEAALRHARSLLSDEGKLLVTVPALRCLWTAHDDLNHHFTRYTAEALCRQATSAALNIEMVRYLFHWTCPIKLAIRVKQRWMGAKVAPPQVPNLLVNRACYALTRFERKLFGWCRLPFGSSLMALASRSSESDTAVATD